MQSTLLQINNIKKHYFEKGTLIKEALKGVSFDLQQGEIFCLLGVNGAGKTTLSSIIATLHPATEGELIYQGKSVVDNLIEYRKIIGFCPQKQNLDLTLTLEENLIFAGKYYGMHKAEIVQRVAELAQKFDLSEYLHQQAQVLSGGFKQRFLIARALMHNPKLVILDEPTVGLDPAIRHQLWNVIKGLKKSGITVLLTTHYMDEANELSDRICIMSAGEIIAIDTPQNLKSAHQASNLEEVFLKLSSFDDKGAV
jgi:ABC-2 type transport system ATP-binding protein